MGGSQLWWQQKYFTGSGSARGMESLSFWPLQERFGGIFSTLDYLFILREPAIFSPPSARTAWGGGSVLNLPTHSIP